MLILTPRDYTDNIILREMSAFPGTEQGDKTKFISGLRERVIDLRTRNVRNFDTIASEIAAHRARYLEESSKLLPL